jgi:hypothetical protein
MSFTEVKYWIMDPLEGKMPDRIDGLDYGAWKPSHRCIKVTISTEGKYPFYNFEVLEDLYKVIDDGETLMHYKEQRCIYTVAIYPDIMSPYYLSLYALLDDVRGKTATRFVSEAFHYYLGNQDNFMKSKHCSSGHNIGIKNPMEVFFPTWHNWWKGLHI